jgi:hypothetical protein
MVESRWLRWIGPGVVALCAVGFIASTTFGAGVRPWAPSACVGPPIDRIAAARDVEPSALGDLRGTPWFRLDPVLDGDGALSGQRLAVGLDGERTSRTLDLSPEAFTAGPFGAIVLVGSDDGTASRVQALDVASGCAWPVADERDVIRRATIDPAGMFIYEMRVDRATRADLGIWRRPVDGTEAARQVLGALPPDGRFGRTFSTEFTWDAAGDRLAVQSCGGVACRLRVIDPGGGPTVTLDDPDLGLIVGLDGDLAVTYEACRGAPLPDRRDRPADRRSPAARAGRLSGRRHPDRGRHPAHPRGGRRDRATAAVRHTRWRGGTRSRARPRRSAAPSVRRPSRRGNETPRRLGPARSRRPATGRRHHRPPAAPPRPGRLDRPAR